MIENQIFEKALDCVRCGTCRVIYADRIQSSRFGKQCPPASFFKIESFSPAGRMYTAVGLMRGKFPYTGRAVDSVYTCTQCGYCQSICEEYVETKTMPVIEQLRNRAVREGVGPKPSQRTCIENLKQTGNIFGKQSEKKFSWLSRFKGTIKNLSLGEYSPNLYFVGSYYVGSTYTENIPLLAAEIIHRAGIEIGVLSGLESCSGYHALSLGYRELFETIARKNIELFNRMGVKRIYTLCPEDFSTIRLRYPEVAPLQAEVIHITSLFSDLVREGKLKLKKNNCRVTYHDPCHLGRYCNMYQPPRDIIRSIPGVDLKEMERNHMDAWCCGAGGGVKIAFPEYAIATARERLEEAISSGADTLVTSCPLCIENFFDAKLQGNVPIAIIDLIQLLRRSLAD